MKEITQQYSYQVSKWNTGILQEWITMKGITQQYSYQVRDYNSEKHDNNGTE